MTKKRERTKGRVARASEFMFLFIVDAYLFKFK